MLSVQNVFLICILECLERINRIYTNPYGNNLLLFSSVSELLQLFSNGLSMKTEVSLHYSQIGEKIMIKIYSY